MSIHDGMPVLARHEGDWEGSYIYVDAEGKIIDQHASHLSCFYPTEGEYAYYQVNRYKWADGKYEEHQFPARYDEEKNIIWWDTPRISGKAWECDEHTVMLTWVYKGNPDVDRLYEMIQISEDNQQRARTWHWYKNGELVKRTLIKEKRIS